MDSIAHVLDRTVLAHDQRLAKVRVHALALRVDADQRQFGPGAVHDVGDAQVQLAGHYGREGLARERGQEGEGDGVDFIVDVEAVGVVSWLGMGRALERCGGGARRERGEGVLSR